MCVPHQLTSCVLGAEKKYVLRVLSGRMNHYRAYTHNLVQYRRASGAPRPGSRRGVLLWVQELVTADDGRRLVRLWKVQLGSADALHPAKLRRQRGGSEEGARA